MEGRLTKLNFDLNDRVKAGDVLALVQTPELLGKPLEVKAPIDGVIIERKSTAGELVGKETQIYTISDPTDLWVMAEMKERDIGAVKVGQDASFHRARLSRAKSSTARSCASAIRWKTNRARWRCASR